MQDCKVNILGAEWEIVQRDEKADVNLDGKFRDGYTDISTHTTLAYVKRKLFTRRY